MIRPEEADLLAVFLDEADEGLAEAGQGLVALDRGFNAEVVQTAFRAIHSVKGNCAFFGLMTAKSLAHELEGVLDHLRHGRIQLRPEIVSGLLDAIDALRLLINEVRAGRGDAVAAEAIASIVDRLRQLGGEASLHDGADLLGAIRTIEEHVIRTGGGTPLVRQALITLIQQSRARLPSPAALATAAPASQQSHPALKGLRAFVAASLVTPPGPSDLDHA